VDNMEGGEGWEGGWQGEGLFILGLGGGGRFLCVCVCVCVD